MFKIFWNALLPYLTYFVYFLVPFAYTFGICFILLWISTGCKALIENELNEDQDLIKVRSLYKYISWDMKKMSKFRQRKGEIIKSERL